MKFAVAVVLLAVAFGAEASAVWGAWGNGAYAPALGASGTFDGHSWNSQWDDGHDSWTGARGAWNDGQWNEGAWGDNGAWSARSSWGAPAIVAGHGVSTVVAAGPALIRSAPVVVAAAPAITHTAAILPAASWGHEGSYVAKTRGAVHVAPLAGHAKSAAAINVHPAPGTV